ncbi:MAG: FixH family protein [Acidobacteriia bacterium]|nr:FixH family protein [Terriglobia bacterium]
MSPALFIHGRLCAVLVSAVLLLAWGCQKAAPTPGDIVVEANFAPRPARMGPATVTVALRDATAKPVMGAHVTVEANMSHPGMSPIFRDAREIAPSRYQADLELGMRGDWVILLHIRLANGEKLERQLAIGVE